MAAHPGWVGELWEGQKERQLPQDRENGGGIPLVIRACENAADFSREIEAKTTVKKPYNIKP